MLQFFISLNFYVMSSNCLAAVIFKPETTAYLFFFPHVFLSFFQISLRLYCRLLHINPKHRNIAISKIITNITAWAYIMQASPKSFSFLLLLITSTVQRCLQTISLAVCNHCNDAEFALQLGQTIPSSVSLEYNCF